jgi:hypothetical protein
MDGQQCAPVFYGTLIPFRFILGYSHTHQSSNDAAYGSTDAHACERGHNWAGVETYGTAFHGQNFANIAIASGIRGWHVEAPEHVRSALSEAFAHPGPALIDVVIDRQELSLPPTITAAQAAGFNLYMLKAMIHGDGHEVLDMAKSGQQVTSESIAAQIPSCLQHTRNSLTNSTEI